MFFRHFAQLVPPVRCEPLAWHFLQPKKAKMNNRPYLEIFMVKMSVFRVHVALLSVSKEHLRERRCTGGAAVAGATPCGPSER